jgi:hypothetical protein
VPDRSNTARIAKRRQCRAERRGRNGVKFRIDLSLRWTPQPASTTPYGRHKTSWGALSPGSASSRSRQTQDLLWSTKMTRPLSSSSDNCLAFALLQSRIALADTSAWPDTTLSVLWTILDDPALNAALGIPQATDAARRNHPCP